MALVDKFGPRIHAMQKNLQQFAHGFGVTDMKLRDRSPNTRRALAVAEYAREQGKLEAFRQRAMDAHWTQGKDLESDADLRALATEAGLDRRRRRRRFERSEVPRAHRRAPRAGRRSGHHWHPHLRDGQPSGRRLSAVRGAGEVRRGLRRQAALTSGLSTVGEGF